jgi:D-2-hydroxyacid dehydrogenase (NADP+)
MEVKRVEIQNILITGRIYQEMAQILLKEKIDKDFRFVSENEVSLDDLLWADAYVGFCPTENFQFGNMKWVHSLGAGVDRFLFNREWKEDVLLTRTVCSFGQKISEYCLSYILRDLQGHDVYAWYQSKRQWKQVVPKPIQEQNIVVYGTGAVGQEVAKNLFSLGVKPIGVSRSGAAKPYFSEVVPVSRAADVMVKADWVINTLPLTKETYKFFDDEFFYRLQNAGFINVGRGATVDDEALLNALEKRYVRLAVLDVFTKEPLAIDSPLWQHPNVIITPHISALTSPKEAVQCFLTTLKHIEENKPIVNKVDVLKGY